MNFAYDKIIQDIGWNQNGNFYKNKYSTTERGNFWLKNIFDPLIDFPYYFKRNNIEANIISLESALKSNDNFVHYITLLSVHRDRNRFQILSTDLVEAINNKQCKLVIWDHEAQPCAKEDADVIVHKLKESMIIPENVILVTSNLLTMKSFPFKVVPWNYWESVMSVTNIDINLKKNPKKFLCLNRRPTDTRTYFVRKMWEKGILDQFNVSLGQVEGTDDFAKTTPYVYDSLSGNFVDGKEGHKEVSWLCFWHQEESYLNIVSESVFDKPDTLDISEKTWKPIGMKMPFIIIGQPFILKKLREYGYKTFPWDESYDEIVDPDKRMESIIDLVVTLNSRKDFVELIESCEDIVDHNFDLLKRRRPEMDMIRALS